MVENSSKTEKKLSRLVDSVNSTDDSKNIANEAITSETSPILVEETTPHSVGTVATVGDIAEKTVDFSAASERKKYFRSMKCQVDDILAAAGIFPQSEGAKITDVNHRNALIRMSNIRANFAKFARVFADFEKSFTNHEDGTRSMVTLDNLHQLLTHQLAQLQEYIQNVHTDTAVVQSTESVLTNVINNTKDTTLPVETEYIRLESNDNLNEVELLTKIKEELKRLEPLATVTETKTLVAKISHIKDLIETSTETDQTVRKINLVPYRRVFFDTIHELETIIQKPLSIEPLVLTPEQRIDTIEHPVVSGAEQTVSESDQIDRYDVVSLKKQPNFAGKLYDMRPEALASLLIRRKITYEEKRARYFATNTRLNNAARTCSQASIMEERGGMVEIAAAEETEFIKARNLYTEILAVRSETGVTVPKTNEHFLVQLRREENKLRKHTLVEGKQKLFGSLTKILGRSVRVGTLAGLMAIVPGEKIGNGEIQLNNLSPSGVPTFNHGLRVNSGDTLKAMADIEYYLTGVKQPEALQVQPTETSVSDIVDTAPTISSMESTEAILGTPNLQTPTAIDVILPVPETPLNLQPETLLKLDSDTLATASEVEPIATPIPSTNDQILTANTRIDGQLKRSDLRNPDTLSSIDTETTVSYNPIHKLVRGDSVWKVMVAEMQKFSNSTFNSLSPTGKNKALMELRHQINIDPELQKISNITSGEADLIFENADLKYLPLVERLAPIAQKILEQEIKQSTETNSKSTTLPSDMKPNANAANRSFENTNISIITTDMTEQFELSFPGGLIAYQKAFQSWVQSIEGFSTDASWFSNLFSQPNHKSAFATLKGMTIAQLEYLVDVAGLNGRDKMSVKDFRKEIKAHGFLINQIRPWLDVFVVWKKELVGHFPNITIDNTFEELAKRVYVYKSITSQLDQQK